MKDYATLPNTNGAFPDVVGVNTSGPGETDGTPYIKQVVDDLFGSRQALMKQAGLIPDTVQESADASQFLDALKILVKQSQTWIANWTHQTNAGAYTSKFLAATHGNTTYPILNRFVIAGETGEIQASADGGETWAVQAPAGAYAGAFHCATFSSALGLYILGGGSGEIQTSPDGLAPWTKQTQYGAYAGSFRGASVSGSLIILVGDSGEIQTSPNGTVWTKQTQYGAYAGSFLDVDYSSDLSLYTAVGTGAEIQTSADALTWAKQTPGASYAGDIRGVASGNSSIVFVGDTAEIQKSEDGSTWIHQAAGPAEPTQSLFQAVINGNGTYTLAGALGIIKSSINGEDWGQRFRDDLFTNPLNALAYGDDMAVVVGDSGEIQTSLRHG